MEEYQRFRLELIQTCKEQIQNLSMNLISVRMQRQFVEKYKKENALHYISEGDKGELIKKIAPIVKTNDTDEAAKRFDNFMFGMMLSKIENLSGFKKAKKQLCEISNLMAKKISIPQVKEKLPVIKEIQNDSFWEAGDLLLFEKVRKEMRDLMKFLAEGTSGDRRFLRDWKILSLIGKREQR